MKFFIGYPQWAFSLAGSSGGVWLHFHIPRVWWRFGWSDGAAWTPVFTLMWWRRG